MILYPEDFSLEEVSNWLKRNIRHVVISSSEMVSYIDLVITDLSKKCSVEELSLNRFRLKECIQEAIAEVIEEYAKTKFYTLLKSNSINTECSYFSPDKEILLSRLSPEHFQKHLFERAGYMNGEETDFAIRLDVLGNIEWWYRNREKEDFYLQGWRSGKFYPDFIIKTKGGKYILAEYKGEDRWSNDDTIYKQELGKLWEKLNNKQNKFLLLGKSSMDTDLKEISTIK